MVFTSEGRGFKKKATVTSACPTNKRMKGRNQNKFRCFLPLSHIESQENHPSDSGHHAFCKYHTSNDVFSRCKSVHKMATGKSDDELIQSDNKMRIGTRSGKFMIVDGT